MKTIPFKPAAEQWVKGAGRDPETRTNVKTVFSDLLTMWFEC
jgi:hypothetical protein